MSDLRSSKQQLRDELNEIYHQMTDPEEQDKARRAKARTQRINELQADYGL